MVGEADRLRAAIRDAHSLLVTHDYDRARVVLSSAINLYGEHFREMTEPRPTMDRYVPGAELPTEGNFGALPRTRAEVAGEDPSDRWPEDELGPLCPTHGREACRCPLPVRPSPMEGETGRPRVRRFRIRPRRIN